jgi:hypothetical protein
MLMTYLCLINNCSLRDDEDDRFKMHVVNN